MLRGAYSREKASEALREALARGIDRRPRSARLARRKRGGVDDVAPALAKEVGQGQPAGSDHRAGVQRDDIIDQLVIQLFEGAAPDVVAGIVDQNVDPAELLHMGIDDPAHVGLVGDVALEYGGGAARVPHRPGHVLGGVGAAMAVDPDAGAVTAKAPGDRGADAGAGAGDQHRLAPELVEHRRLPRCAATAAPELGAAPAPAPAYQSGQVVASSPTGTDTP